MTSAPRRRRSSGAKLPAMPLPASTTTLSLRARAIRAATASKYSWRGSRFVRRAAVDHLHAIVRDGVVAARHGRSALELPVGGREVEERRVVGPDVHYVQT